MQRFFSALKNDNFQIKNYISCLIFAHNIDCGGTQIVWFGQNTANVMCAPIHPNITA